VKYAFVLAILLWAGTCGAQTNLVPLETLDSTYDPALGLWSYSIQNATVYEAPPTRSTRFVFRYVLDTHLVLWDSLTGKTKYLTWGTILDDSVPLDRLADKVQVWLTLKELKRLDTLLHPSTYIRVSTDGKNWQIIGELDDIIHPQGVYIPKAFKGYVQW
jgi:hypothetical protein